MSAGRIGAFPLLDRELLRGGKRVLPYVMRLVPPGVAVIILLGASGFGLTITMTTGRALDYIGTSFANWALIFQYFAVFGLTPVFAGASIAEERREGTLGLLLMANFRPSGILLTKFLTAFLQIELLLFSTLPLAAIAAMMGGVDVPVLAVQTALLSVAAAMVCSVAVFASTLTDRPIEAIAMTFLFEALWFLGPILTIYFTSGSQSMAEQHFAVAIGLIELNTIGDPAVWGIGLATTLGIMFLAALGAWWRLPRCILSETARPRRRYRIGTARGWFGLEISPHAKLVIASAPQFRVFTWPGPARLAVAILLAALLMFTFVLGPVIVVMGILMYVTFSQRTAYREGAYALIFTTPIGDRELARAIFAAYFDRAMLFLPALFASICFMLVDSSTEISDMLIDLWEPYVGFYPVAVFYFILLFVGCVVATAAVTAAACMASTLYLPPAVQTVAGLVGMAALHLGGAGIVGIITMVSSLIMTAVAGPRAAELSASLVAPVAIIGAYGFAAAGLYDLFAQDVKLARRRMGQSNPYTVDTSTMRAMS